jgi:hypothetical protein
MEPSHPRSEAASRLVVARTPPHTPARDAPKSATASG